MLSQKLGAALLFAAAFQDATRLQAARLHLKTREVETANEASGFLSPVRRAGFERRHMVLEFERPVNQELLAALATRDIRVTNALGGSVLAVSVPESVRLEELGISWSGQLLPADKLSPELDRESVPVHAWMVKFHNDVDAQTASNVLTENGLTIVPHPDLLPGEFLVTGNRASLAAVADYDETAYIFPASLDMLAGKHMMACEGALTQGGSTAQYVKVGSGWSPNTPNGVILNYVFTKLTNKVSPAQVKSEIARAMRQWSAIANVKFQPGNNPGDPHTVAIEFGTTVNGDPNPFTSLSTLAHTYYPAAPNPEPIAGDMHFNPGETWHTGATTDIYTVALHELGHSLGLGHTDNPSDVMYPYYRFGTTLSTNDVAGVQSMYGPAVVGSSTGGGNSLPPPASLSLVVSSPADGSSTTNSSTTFTGTVLNPSGTAVVAWQTSNGQSGRAATSSTTPTSVSWVASGVPLASGSNLITVTASDNSTKSVSRVVRVTGTSSGGGPGNPGGSVPVINVTSPQNGLITTAASLAISGVASDSEGIQTVSWQTNSQASGIALGTNDWTASGIPLYPGQNVVVVQATNTHGVSRWVSLTITKQ